MHHVCVCVCVCVCVYTYAPARVLKEEEDLEGFATMGLSADICQIATYGLLATSFIFLTVATQLSSFPKLCLFQKSSLCCHLSH
jgi:hypothetical protein